MNIQHQNLADGRWAKMPLEEQLGNIGSEFERSLRWKEKNQTEYFQKATDRMLELFDLTLADKRWHNHRLKEIARARDAACAELYDDKEFSGNPEGLKRYFYYFAFLARS